MKQLVAKRMLQLLSFVIVPTILIVAALNDSYTVVGVSIMVELLVVAVLGDVKRQEQEDLFYREQGKQHHKHK